MKHQDLRVMVRRMAVRGSDVRLLFGWMLCGGACAVR
jgi:hypothetical protein